MIQKNNQRPFLNPYLAGIGLGIVLLATFIFIGRGIGVSGAFEKISASTLDASLGTLVKGNTYIQSYKLQSKSLLDYWIIIEVLGIFAGGFLSSKLAKRQKTTVMKGQTIQNNERYKFALIGGVLMGFGSRLARGCTSGQALTGGALLNLGSWAFMISIFIGGYLLAHKMKRAWS